MGGPVVFSPFTVIVLLNGKEKLFYVSDSHELYDKLEELKKLYPEAQITHEPGHKNRY